MRALIVDDEPIARQVLRELLEEFPFVTIAGEAASGAGALEQIHRQQPDLILLDMQMPGLDGLSVVRSLRGARLPLVIFVTAYQEYAVSAFEVEAVDYLLKPVRRERLAAALEKARSQIERLREAPPAPAARKVVGRSGDDYYLLDPSEVILFVAEGDTVHVVTTNRRLAAIHTLRDLEKRLGAPFRRIHRKAIINTDHIRKISPLSSRRWLLKLSNGAEAVVSKRLAGLIREQMRG
jgi:DNA-binding LytR/AlgR family response regulator